MFNKSGLYVVKFILWSVISTGKYLAVRYLGMCWLKLVSERFHRNSPVSRWLSSQSDFAAIFLSSGSCLCAVRGHPQDRAVKAKGSKTVIFGVQKLVSGSLT